MRVTLDRSIERGAGMFSGIPGEANRLRFVVTESDIDVDGDPSVIILRSTIAATGDGRLYLDAAHNSFNGALDAETTSFVRIKRTIYGANAESVVPGETMERHLSRRSFSSKPPTKAARASWLAIAESVFARARAVPGFVRDADKLALKQALARATSDEARALDEYRQAQARTKNAKRWLALADR